MAITVNNLSGTRPLIRFAHTVRNGVNTVKALASSAFNTLSSWGSGVGSNRGTAEIMSRPAPAKTRKTAAPTVQVATHNRPTSHSVRTMRYKQNKSTTPNTNEVKSAVTESTSPKIVVSKPGANISFVGSPFFHTQKPNNTANPKDSAIKTQVS